MMCAKLLKHGSASQHGRLYRLSELGFDTVIAGYGKTLRWVLHHQSLTQFVTFCTLAATLLLYIYVPNGFFPVQDTGAILGVSESEQSISFLVMAARNHRLAKLFHADHDILRMSSIILVVWTD